MSTFETVAASWLGIGPGGVEMISDGVNKNLRATTPEGMIFVRFSPESLHSRAELENEFNLLLAFQEQDLPSVIPSGSNPVGGPKEIAGQVYNWFANEQIDGSPLQANPTDVRDFGKSLAQVHRFNGPLGAIKRPARAELPEDDLAEIHNRVAEAISSTPDHTGPIGICHGDAWLGNGLRTPKGVVLFDFEYTHIGQQIYDLGTFLWGLSPADSLNAAGLFSEFLAGYSSQRALRLDPGSLRRALLEKEFDNLLFLRRHIVLSDPIVDISIQSAQALIEFATQADLSHFLGTEDLAL
jgi:aminoglycoside phosphotransferase (APT) family kinase protein